MSPSRSYQVEELTRGIQLPLPPLQRRPLRVISELITEAWTALQNDQGQVLQTAPENEINALMEARLNSILEQNEQYSMLITSVTRGRESMNHDGSKLETRPDLSITLTCRSHRMPLIVECKLIDKANGKSVDLYCREGLGRFVVGQYAWYAQEAFMLAYVRDRATIATCLVPHLQAKQETRPDPFCTKQLPNPALYPVTDLAPTRHGRQFNNSSGDIDVWHLWVS